MATTYRKITTFFVLFLTTCCAAPAYADAEIRCDQRDKKGICSLYFVSMIELIANPARFHGKVVGVHGYISLGFERSGLYLHEEDSKRRIHRNGLSLALPIALERSPECKNESYVMVSGKFNAKNGGHKGMWSGTLDNVTLCKNMD